MQINDAIVLALGGGQINDLLMDYYGGTGALQDRERAYLLANGGSGGTNQDMWFEVLRGLGYTGSLNDMLLEFWINGGVVDYTKAVLTPEENQGGTHRGFGNNQLNPSTWYGSMNPDNLFGRVIWQWTVTTNTTCVIAIANDDNTAATGKIDGVDSFTMTLEGYTPITYSWTANRYEAQDAGFFAYLGANLGTPLNVTYDFG